MILATETEADILFGELSEALAMVKRLQEDLVRGKEPDGSCHIWDRSDQGRRMTMKLVKERLHHINARMTRALSQNSVI